MGEGYELRMYFFVPYNISPIQQAIQAGHAALEYARKYKDDKEFTDFVDYHKTWIILNGGTTNSKCIESANIREDENPYIGTLDNIYNQLLKNKIKCSSFQEPDLNEALTAVCFIADKRVFDYEEYPDFKQFLLSNKKDLTPTQVESIHKFLSFEEMKDQFERQYIDWEESLGGHKNVFLRNLLKGKKLA